MVLDPETKDYLEKYAGKNQWQLLPVTEAREAHQKWQVATSVFSAEYEADRRSVQAVDSTVLGVAGGVPVRIYRPSRFASDDPLPIVIFFHGGGFVIGDLETHDELCRELSARVDAMVIAVAYRLAPENRFPAAVEDCIAVTEWVIANAPALGGDGARVSLAGDSAGGNLAAVVALHVSNMEVPRLAFLLLIYPVVDNTAAVEETPSALRFATGYELSMDALQWFQGQYFGDDELARRDISASPLLSDDFSGLPPTLIIVAELDPLADSAVTFGRRLRDAGIEVRVSVYPGVMHAFVTMGSFFHAALDAMDESVAALRDAFQQ